MGRRGDAAELLVPTLGKTDDGSSSSTSSANRTQVSPATPGSSGKVVSGGARIWMDTAGSTNTKLVIYADSAGAPGAKLAESDVVNISSTTESEVAYTFSGGNQIDVVSGTPYWVGVAFQDPGTPAVRYSRDGTASGRLENTAYAPDPYGSGTPGTGTIDAYITYNLPVDSDGGAFFEFF